MLDELDNIVECWRLLNMLFSLHFVRYFMSMNNRLLSILSYLGCRVDLKEGRDTSTYPIFDTTHSSLGTSDSG